MECIGWSNPEYNPIHDRWKPIWGTSDSLSDVRAPLRSLSRSPGENLSYPPGMDNKRHDTYILLMVLVYMEAYT